MKINNLKRIDLNLKTENFPFHSFDSLNEKKDNKSKLFFEKRKRHQGYTILNYILSVTTYFDFFSNDALKIVLNSKYIGQVLSKNIVNSEFLLLPFFTFESPVSKILKKHKLTKKIISSNISTLNQISPTEVKDIKKQIKKNKNTFFKSIKFSHETNLLFEKAAENALTRFKTPVITTEILFITLMEEKETRASKIVKKLINNETEWYLLRYNLLKNLYRQELVLRKKVSKNHQYFGYLLKTQLSDLEFEKMIETKTFNERISIFRSKLIKDVVKENWFDFLSKEINKSIKYTTKRTYSS